MGSTASVPTFRLEPYSYTEVRRLMDALELAEPVAVTLVRRGHRTVEAARAFLDADEEHDPFEFDAMRDVVARIRSAIAAGRRITVHGDYDVDGVCSTAILVGALRDAGAECDWFIPNRLSGGYGLSHGTIETLAQRGTGLLITTDCGITAVEEVAAARTAGLEVIVTDHHQPGQALPNCPILHPVVSGYPCPELCATGVAHKLAAALGGPESAAGDLDLVALATVADMVPLQGENRALVRKGLEAARRAVRPGLRALMASAAVEPTRLDEGDLAFRLGPRINAAGRLYRADAGVELMLTRDDERAEAIAADLERANRERRSAELEVLSGAEQAYRELGPDLDRLPALVLAGTGWHPGVVGIVASRLVEAHGVPVVLVSVGEDGMGRGSGRSIPGFDLLGGLEACGEHLARFGGHRAAAGLEIEAERIPAFRDAFCTHAAQILGERPGPPPEAIDAIVGGESLGADVAEQLERLGPFGLGNPGVRLLVPSARLRDVRPMGEGEKHARFLIQSGSRSAVGVAFGVNGSLAGLPSDETHDLSVRLELNHWNGAVEPRVVYSRRHAQALPPAGAEVAGYPDFAEWLSRVTSQLEAPPESWSRGSERAPAGRRRELVDCRGHSGIACVARLVSSGEPVLILCADALRRRELVERAVVPARFGGGEVALASGRLTDLASRAAAEMAAAAGTVLADWPALERLPALTDGFVHVVAIDPPPFEELHESARRGQGYLHEVWGRPEAEFAARVHDSEWPSRDALAFTYRAVARGAASGSLSGEAARAALDGAGALPRSPEVAGRLLRILVEIGSVKWAGSGADCALGVVSSEKMSLDSSAAFAACRARHEEGRRYLSSRTPVS